MTLRSFGGLWLVGSREVRSSFCSRCWWQGALPDWAAGAVGNQIPDLLVTQSGFRANLAPVLPGRAEVEVSWSNAIGKETGGGEGSVSFGRGNTVISVWEVTTGWSPLTIGERAAKVAGWASMLGKAKTGPFTAAAVLAIDRGAFYRMPPEERAKIVKTVTGAGGYIRLYRDLTKQAIKNAQGIAADLAAQ